MVSRAEGSARPRERVDDARLLRERVRWANEVAALLHDRTIRAEEREAAHGSRRNPRGTRMSRRQRLQLNLPSHPNSVLRAAT